MTREDRIGAKLALAPKQWVIEYLLAWLFEDTLARIERHLEQFPPPKEG